MLQNLTPSSDCYDIAGNFKGIARHAMSATFQAIVGV